MRVIVSSLAGLVIGLLAVPLVAAEPLAIGFAEACPAGPDAPAVTAVGLRAAAGGPPPAARVLVLVDTSASQTGEFRQRSLEAVAGLIAAGRPVDRFAIAAVDVATTPLTEGFAAAGDESLRAAALALDARTPLGSTELIGALDEAIDRLRGDGPAVIVYVGDGPALNGVDPEEFAKVVDRLRAERIPVCSLGIGPAVNWQCLAALAANTGGSLLVPLDTDDAKQAGGRLAALAVEPVTWPVDISVASGAENAAVRMLPTRAPPLRADRDSVVLIEGTLTGGRLRVSLGDPAAPRQVSLPIPAAAANEGNAFLAEMVRNCRASAGLFLPVLGRDGLDVARGVVRDEAARLAALAAQAEATGSHASALRLAEASLRRDPDNPDAAVVREVARRQAVPAPPPPEPRFTPPPRDELDELDEMRSRRAEEQERDAAIRIREARQLLTTDPDLARDRLKQLQQEIRSSEDLGPAARERLLSQLEMRIRESITRSREKTERDLAAERRAAIGRERQRLTGELKQREEKIRLLTDKFNALVEEGIRVGYAQSQNYPEVIGDLAVGGDESVTGNEPPTRAFTEAERIAGEQISREAPPLYANHPVPMTARVVGRTAPLVARILDYDAQNYRTLRDQQRGFMDVLHLVDVAGIPFPDEPPVAYPSAARWREISRLRDKYKSVDLANPGSREQKIFDALDTEVEDFSFPEGSTLLDLQKAVQGQFPGLPVEFDKKAFDDEGLDPSTLEITQQPISQVTLRAALRRLLGSLDLTYMVKDEVLLITTQAEAENNLVVKVYPVADLVLPVDPGSGLNPFQTGGGLGGQNSINSGMNMGGGMGGAGGGMGMGGGGGIGGFGNCWVAREVYGVHNPRWLAFRQWMGSGAPAWLRDLYAARGEAFAGWLRDKPALKAVIRSAMDAVLATQGYPPPRAEGGLFQISAARDRIAASSGSGAGRVTPVAAAEAATPAASDSEQPSRTGLPADVLDAADLQAALRTYLASVAVGAGGTAVDQRDAADRMARLRASAADLGRDGRFDRAADLISAAIAAGHAEPWMYESLAVALEAAGRPRADVERTLLSAADFAGSSVELLQLAHYMARFGFDQQAIRMCRRVTRGDPANREAYALAMAVAARTEDGDALRWACPGVLAHDWPASQQEVATRAARLARATIGSLRAAGRAADADTFQAAVDRALVRDLVIDLAWTGDADVDITVQEPTGSVCSLTLPRSPAGGTLLADGDAGGDGTTHRERYVVSEAFPGEYRVLVKRSWGKVAADTVTAEMTIHRGTDREQTITRQVRLGADDQMLTVTLPDGRRKEPLVEAQLAQDVAAQRALGRAVLAQQLAAITDPATAASMAASREAVVGPAPVPGLPFFGRGAVGYQPVITTLPEGVNLYARAVVSADRRYVRVTSVPLFSGVGNVTQFNFAGGGTGAVGAGGQVGGAAGGQLGGGAGGQLGGGAGFGAGGQLGGAGGIGAGPAAGAAAGVGAGAGGQLGGICWVAREVYGDLDPRWLVFRDWLQSDAPRWLHDLYAARGEGFAAWLRDKPAARAGVRFLLDLAIAGRDQPTAR